MRGDNNRIAKPKVFGLGFSRTGTTSLNRALQRLGYKVRSYDPALLRTWCSGDSRPLLASLEKHDAFEDWPYALAFREIIERYGGGARYILTVRKSSEVWIASQIAHSERTSATPSARLARQLVFGYAQARGNESQHIELYDKHNAAVRQAIAEAQLESCFAELCWERGDGWNELCALLGREKPPCAFPHENRGPSSPDTPPAHRENPQEVSAHPSAPSNPADRRSAW